MALSKIIKLEILFWEFNFLKWVNIKTLGLDFNFGKFGLKFIRIAFNKNL